MTSKVMGFSLIWLMSLMVGLMGSLTYIAFNEQQYVLAIFLAPGVLVFGFLIHAAYKDFIR